MGSDGKGSMEKPLAGMVICCTSVLPEVRTRYSEYVLQMGAEHKLDLTSDVTHLLVGDADTAKYKYVAKEREDVKVLQPEWVEAVRNCWMEAKPLDLEALHRQYRLPTLFGLKICITGFDDLTFRAQLQKNVIENGGEYTGDLTKDVTHLIAARPEGKKYEYGTQWQKKVVSLKWYKDTLQRGMQLDEKLYHPSTPIDEQGMGAWTRQTVPTTMLGKRARDDVVGPEPPRKLRRTFSAKMGSQNETMWTDIVGGAGFEVADGERPALKATKSLPTLPHSTSVDGPEHQANAELRAKSDSAANRYLSGHTFVVHGFEQKQASHVCLILQSCGASVFDSISRASEGDSVHEQAHIMIVPYQTPLERLPAQFMGDVVSEFWLEWCMFKKAFVAPKDYFLGSLVSQNKVQGFSKLTVSTTGFAPIQTLQIAKMVRLMGGSYDEVFKPSTSVLVCKEGNTNRQKLEYANLWNLPAVNEKWLLACIRENRIPSYDGHRMNQPVLKDPDHSRKHDRENRIKPAGDRDRPKQASFPDTADDRRSLSSVRPPQQQLTSVKPSGDSRHRNGPLKEISANSPTKRHDWETEGRKKDFLSSFDGVGREPGQDGAFGGETGKENLSNGDRDVNGAIRDLMEMKAKSKSSSNAIIEEEPKKKRLFGRALSNLSNSSAKSNVKHSRASSVDSVNTDGVGSEIGPAASDKDKSSTFRGRALSGLMNESMPVVDWEDPGFYQTGKAEEAETPALTQLVYDDPEESVMLREKLEQRRRQRSKPGQKAEGPTAAQQQEPRRIQDDDLIVNAGWGAGRRTRHKDRTAQGLKDF